MTLSGSKGTTIIINILKMQTVEPPKDIKPLTMANMSSLREPDPANITKQDILSSLAFDKQGQYLSVGDRGGRVIVF